MVSIGSNDFRFLRPGALEGIADKFLPASESIGHNEDGETKLHSGDATEACSNSGEVPRSQ